MKVTIPEPDQLSDTETLSDDQKQAIEELKNQDWVAENIRPPELEDKPAKKEPEDASTQDPEKKSTDDKKPEEESDSEKPKETDEEKQKAEAAEQERLEKKAKEEGKTVDEVKRIEETEKAEQERIEKIAKEENRSVDEVREDLTKDKSISDRHGNDPLKIARALRKEQSEYGKLKNEADGLRKFKSEAEAKQKAFNEQSFERQCEAGREKIIEQFRAKFPTQPDGRSTDELSDDAVFERGKAIIRDALKSKESKAQEEAREKASSKRVDIIKNLPDEFKDYVPEVKELLEQCGDVQVLNEEFDVSYLANYARGKKFTPEYIKSLEEAAYKRGVEKAKIVPPSPRKEGGGNKVQGGNGSALNNQQKTRAEEIYGRREGWTKQKMWDEYAANDLKADSQW